MSDLWEIRLSNSKNLPYFYNNKSKRSYWEPPAELTQEQIQQLKGADEYLNPKNITPMRMRASHILIKHSKSRRPASWQDPHITRSLEEAMQLLQNYRQEIIFDPVHWDKVARLHSDCSSHDAAGDLGWFTKGQMQKPFEEAVLALKVGEMSDVVQTDSGIHIIKRTG